MNEQPQTGAIWGILAAIVLIIALIGGSVYAIGDLGVQRERAVADAQNARASIAQAQAQAQIEITRAHEAGSTERMQIFALTLKSLSNDHSLELTLLSAGVLILGILQLVSAITRPRGDA